LSDTREHEEHLSSPRHRQHTSEENRRNRNLTVYEKAHLSHSSSCHGFIFIDDKPNISSADSHCISALDKRDGKVSRINSGSHIDTDSKCHWKDSFGSKRKHHSSTDMTDNRLPINVNGKQFSSQKHKPAHRRSNSAGTRVKSLAFNVEHIDSSVFKEYSSNNALKRSMEKKSRQFNYSPHDEKHQNSRKETKGLVKTPVHRELVVSGSAKHKKKTPPSSVKRNGTLDLYCYILRSNVFKKWCKFLFISCHS